MKNLFNKLSKKLVIFLSIITFSVVVFAGSFAFASNKPTVVVFYTSWNALSREAISKVEANVASYGQKVDFTKINIDEPAAPAKAREVGVTSPKTTPYVVLVNKNGKVVYQSVYSSQTINQMNEVLSVLVQ